MSVVRPFAHQRLGVWEFGDGGPVRVIGRASATLVATVVPPGIVGATLHASIICASSSAATLWGRVLPALSDFSINGVTAIPRPQAMIYHRPTVLGRDLTGVDVIQGYSAMDWQYQVLTDGEIGALMALYDPAQPRVTITYPNEYGQWVQKTCMLQPPNLGTRSTVVHNNVVLSFTHIPSD